MKWWDWMPWSSLFECWVLSQLFYSSLSPSRSSLVPPLCKWIKWFKSSPFQVKICKMSKRPSSGSQKTTSGALNNGLDIRVTSSGSLGSKTIAVLFTKQEMIKLGSGVSQHFQLQVWTGAQASSLTMPHIFYFHFLINHCRQVLPSGDGGFGCRGQGERGDPSVKVMAGFSATWPHI